MQNSIKFDNVNLIRLDDKIPFGLYLAKAVLHYTVGTEITPSVSKDLLSNGIRQVYATNEKPQIQPMMIRIQDTASVHPDWIYRLYSQGLKKSILEGVQHGNKSSTQNISFVHPYIHGLTFGRSINKSKY